MRRLKELWGVLFQWLSGYKRRKQEDTREKEKSVSKEASDQLAGSGYDSNPPKTERRGCCRRAMPLFFDFRRPGPTTLTWEDENPVDYVYRPRQLKYLAPFSKRKRNSLDRNRQQKSAKKQRKRASQ